MDNMVTHHGSNMEVMNPKVLINGHYKDFVVDCRRGVEHKYDIVEI